MARRTVLTGRQRDALLALPTDEPTLLQHHVLNDVDLGHIRRRRRPQNRLGFALQLCAFRYPGRLLQPGEVIPEAMLAFIGAQIGLSGEAGEALAGYGERQATRYHHSIALQQLYGYRPFEGAVRKETLTWLRAAAERARTNDALAADFVAELRRRKIIIPGLTTLERCCADALVAADRAIVQRIADRIDSATARRLLAVLDETADDQLSRFVWLRQFEAGANSADINRMLDRLDYLETIGLDRRALDGVPPHRVSRLRRLGERYYADGVRDLPAARQLAILAACVVEWRAGIADAILETHERIVGRLYREAERQCEAQVQDQRTTISQTLREFADLGAALVRAHEDGEDLTEAVLATGGWPALRQRVEHALVLTRQVGADPLDYVVQGYPRFRRYAPRMLERLPFRGSRPARSLLDALELLRQLNRRSDSRLPPAAPVGFLRTKWRKRLLIAEKPDRPLWESAVLFELRNALKAGDVWLADSQRYGEVETALVPTAAVSSARLAVPMDGRLWLDARAKAIGAKLASVARVIDQGQLPTSALHGGQLHVDRLEKAVPDGAEDLVLALYRDMPQTRITDLLLEVDERIAFTSAFTDLRTGIPCRDRVGVLSVLLADGVNLGLKKMAEACSTHSFWELLRIGRWFVREDTTAQALSMVVEAQRTLPMAKFWGAGITSSSDGQHFTAGGMGEAMNAVNARYGNEPGINAYSHVNDQYAPFASQVIPATVHEAPYILDGLLQNDAGRRIAEHYADTGGFTDHVFAACSVLGFRFAPRIRDLADKRLYVFDPKAAPALLQPLVGSRINARLIAESWPDVLRLTASMATGAVVPSQVLRKLAAYPRQNRLAAALREIGRVERTLFLLDWLADRDLQRRVQIGLNKGEAHHALKRAISFHRRGEIRDRTSEGQHHRIAALNLLAAIIIYWNSWKLGEVVARLVEAGQAPALDLLPHVSPLGWEHITLTGEYRWRSLG